MTAQDAVLRWGEAAAEEFGYARPSPDWAAAAVDRIGPDVMSAVLAGVASGDVELIGPRFRLPALGRAKGPYAWFSRSARGVPAPNWEYFVQVATWLQVRADVPAHAVVGFEDGLMDVSVRVGGDVVWCVEVRERAAQLQTLLRRLWSTAGTSTWTAPTATTTRCARRSTSCGTARSGSPWLRVTAGSTTTWSRRVRRASCCGR